MLRDAIDLDTFEHALWRTRCQLLLHDQDYPEHTDDWHIMTAIIEEAIETLSVGRLPIIQSDAPVSPSMINAGWQAHFGGHLGLRPDAVTLLVQPFIAADAKDAVLRQSWALVGTAGKYPVALVEFVSRGFRGAEPELSVGAGIPLSLGEVVTAMQVPSNFVAGQRAVGSPSITSKLSKRARIAANRVIGLVQAASTKSTKCELSMPSAQEIDHARRCNQIPPQPLLEVQLALSIEHRHVQH